MRALIGCFLAILFVALSAAAPAQEKAAPGKVELKVVKYDGLGDLVRDNRGKVVVVDFWATTCIPCRKEMPNLVKMHQKFAKDGLVAVTVALDEEATSSEVQGAALKILQQMNATFPNVLLDEKPEVWQEKLRFSEVPCVYVFDRQGKWRQFKDEPNYADIEKVVVELLQKK